MEDAAITVVLPVRNGAAFVGQAIESVLGQTFRGVRLRVSDNGSTDATHAVVSRYLADPRVRLVTRTAPLGMLEHFNQCLAELDTEYYMLLCHDDYLCEPSALEKAHRALEANPGISSAYCDLAYVDARGRPIATRRFGRAGAIPGDALAKSSVVECRNLFGIPLLVRTGALQGARYDDQLPYSADLDLSIAIAGHRSVFHIPEPLIANRYHADNATFGVFRTALDQVTRIAARHAIALSATERLLMRLNAWKMVVIRWAFLQYATRLRKAS